MALGVAGRTYHSPQNDHAAVRAWLMVVALLVVVMVAVGGLTRLTDSGLSITEWKPILGAIPPLSVSDWQEAFEKYKQIPEYREINRGMSLAEFKVIFWWEWAHRFLGRLIGLAFALPLIWFWARGKIPNGYRLRLLALLLLGGLQGFIGWYMVQSGLSERVDVSHYRLALHLCMAFFILGLLVWTWADLSDEHEIFFRSLPRATWTLAAMLACLIFVQVGMGAFVAGTKAGLVYNTWPLMDGELLPRGLYVHAPQFMSVTEDHLTIQFNHRMMAYLLVLLCLVQVVRLRGIDNDKVSKTAALVAVLVVAQVGLGVWTLLSAADGSIPIGLGVAHQTLAAIVLAASVLHLNAVGRALRS